MIKEGGDHHDATLTMTLGVVSPGRSCPGSSRRTRTVYCIFRRWVRDGSWRRIHDALRDLVRVYEGRDPAPTAAIIDSASVRGAETVPGPSRGYDAGNHAGRAVMPGRAEVWVSAPGSVGVSAPGGSA